jgi:cysteine desulfurase
MGIFKVFSGTRGPKKRAYFDYASSTPLDAAMLAAIPRIPDAILAANPSALHAQGVALKQYLEDARRRVALTLHAHTDEIVFTGNATESDNLALVGCVKSLRAGGLAPGEIMVVTSDMEHSAVSESLKAIAEQGIQTATIATDRGVINPKDIVLAEGIKALIVSVIWVQNEIGTVQPVHEIAKHLRFLRKHAPEAKIIFHIDATQAPLHMDLNVQKLGIDMMTLGATKLYCTKGVGMLYVKRGTPIAPVLHGGGQERGLRPGTEAVGLIHEFSYALEYAQENREAQTHHVTELQRYFETLLAKELPDLVVTAKGLDRTPHITHIGINDFDSELMVIELDARGVAVSAKSACKNEGDDESPIVESLYGKGWGAVRFSFGRMTTKKEAEKAIGALKEVLDKYKK